MKDFNFSSRPIDPNQPMTKEERFDLLFELGKDNRDWYYEANCEILEFVRRESRWGNYLDPAYVAGVLSLTSVKHQLTRNIRQAIAICCGQGALPGLMNSHKVGLANWLLNRKINGPKTGAFYENLTGNLEPVTLDVWMSRVLEVDQKEFSSKKKYAAYSEVIASMANKRGMEPAEAQAVLWLGMIKLETGDLSIKKKPYPLLKEYGNFLTQGRHFSTEPTR